MTFLEWPDLSKGRKALIVLTTPTTFTANYQLKITTQLGGMFRGAYGLLEVFLQNVFTAVAGEISFNEQHSGAFDIFTIHLTASTPPNLP